jgi:hypothetical protein
MHAGKVIVQSEKIRQTYVSELKRFEKEMKNADAEIALREASARAQHEVADNNSASARKNNVEADLLEKRRRPEQLRAEKDELEMKIEGNPYYMYSGKILDRVGQAALGFGGIGVGAKALKGVFGKIQGKPIRSIGY